MPQGVRTDCPTRVPLSPKRVVRLAVAIVRGPGGNVLVRKRETGGLLRGLWEFPNWEVLSNERYEDAVLEGLHDWGIQVETMQPIGKARHVFTHLIWEMQGFTANIKKSPPPPGCVWKKANNLEALAWSSAMTKWLKTVQSTKKVK